MARSSETHPPLHPKLHDFRNFQYLVWKHLHWPEPDPIASDMAREIQQGPQRMLVMAYREATKSATTVAYCLWQLLVDPETKILIVSAGASFSKNLATWMWQLLNEMEVLHHLIPTDDQRASKIEFDVWGIAPSKEPSVACVGVNGQATGRRADVIVLDDVETPKNTETPYLRIKLQDRVVEYDNILRKNKYARFLVLGTPHTEESVYRTFEHRGFKVYVWPQRFPEPDYQQFLGSRLAPMLAKQLDEKPDLGTGGGEAKDQGQPTNPGRFSEEACREQEKRVGRSQYRLQYQLDTRLSDANRYPLKCKDIPVFELDGDLAPQKVVCMASADNDTGLPCVGFNGDRFYRPFQVMELKPYIGKVLAIDPAGMGGDEVGFAVVGSLNSQLFLLEAGGLEGGYADENLEKLAKIAVRWKVDVVRFEDNFGDGMMARLFQPVLLAAAEKAKLQIGIISEKVTEAKERRIIKVLEPILNQHRLIVNRTVVEKDYRERRAGISESQALHYQLFYQLTRLTHEVGCLRYDDRVDALYMAVKHWENTMSGDIDKQIGKGKDKEKLDAIRKFKAGLLKRPLSPSHTSSKVWVKALQDF